MKLFSRSLTFKLVGYFSALSLFTVCMLGAIALLESKRTLNRSIFERLETTANLQQETLDIWFENQHDHYAALSQNPELRELTVGLLNQHQPQSNRQFNQRGLELLLQREISTSQGIQEILVLDEATGVAVYSTQPEHLHKSYGDTSFFQAGRRQSYVRYPVRGDRGFVFSQPIKGEFQEFVGVLVVRLDASELARTVLQFHKPQEGQYSYLVTQDDNLLTGDSVLAASWQQGSVGTVEAAIADHSGQNKYKNSLGAQVWGVYHWLPDQQLALIVEIDENKALQPLNALVWKVVLLGSGVMILAIAGSYFMARLITKPILAIQATATEVTQGNLHIKAPIFTKDEVGDLAQTFNQMTGEFSLLYDEFNDQVTQLEMAEISAQQSFHELQIEKRKVDLIMDQLEQANEEISLLNERLKTENLDLAAEIQATNERLNQFLEAIPVGILVLEGSGQVIYVNRKAQLLLGGNAHHIPDNDNNTLFLAENQAPCPPEKMLGQRALKHKVSSTYDDIEIHRDDQVIPVESWETPILDEAETVKYAIVAFQDITERRQAELEKQNYTRKLWQLNQANERFVPRQFLQLLDKNSIVDVQLGDNVQKEMTVLFADIRGFTRLSEGMTPEDNFKFINAFLSRMNPAISNHWGFIDKYIGDAIMALFSRSDHADDSLRAAIAMLKTLDDYNQTRQRPDRPPIRIGLGLNSGLMRCGTVGGDQHMESTVISDAVNLASRLERLTKVYRTSLLISHHTFLRLTDYEQYHIRLIDHVTVTGKSIAVSVYEVFDVDSPEIAAAKRDSKSTFEQAFVLFRLGQFIKAQKLFNLCLEQCPQDYVSQLYVDRCQQNMITTANPQRVLGESYLDIGKL